MVVYNITTALGFSEIHHSVCVRQPGGALQTPLVQKGVPVHAPERYLGARGIRRTLDFIEQVVDIEGIDILHAHLADAAIHGWLVSRRRSLPLVITHHGEDLLPNSSRFSRLVFRILLTGAVRHAYTNVAVAPSVAENLRRKLWLNDDQVSVFPNGVPILDDEPAFPDPIRTSTAPHVIMVGRLVELKGHKQLIDAAALLRREFPGLQVTFIGDGPLRAQLQQKAASLGLDHCLKFAGIVEDVQAHLCEADVYVSTSHYEGMPMATLEAMAAGVPVVASDVPGNRTVVTGGESGLLYELGNTAALAARVSECLRDPAKARARAQCARSLVEQQYSSKAAAQRYSHLYSAVLASR
jgi:glycosyltransferase involved in cell wall biosynthesis